MNKLDAVILDFDGVVADTFELTYGITKSLRPEGLTRQDFRNQFMGNFYKKSGYSDEHNRKFFAIQNEKIGEVSIDKAVADTLHKLAKLTQLHIVSSNQEEAIVTFLHVNDVRDCIGDVLGMDTEKSKVKKFQMLFEKHNISPEHALFVTDTVGDILEAREVGVPVAAIQGYHSIDMLRKENPDYILPNFAHLLRLIT